MHENVSLLHTGTCCCLLSYDKILQNTLQTATLNGNQGKASLKELASKNNQKQRSAWRVFANKSAKLIFDSFKTCGVLAATTVQTLH
jgi:DUF438 domain-containing protein